MKQLTAQLRHRTRLGTSLRAFLAAAIVLPMLAFSPAAAPTAQAHPLLLQVAAHEPGKLVSVIVQKNGADKSVEARVAEMGGVVTKDLYIINALAADMTAEAAAQLSKTSGVRWVSLNAPVVDASNGPDIKAGSGYEGTGETLPDFEPATRGQMNANTEGDSISWASDVVAASNSSISSSFNSNTIPANSYLWFNSVLRVNGINNNTVTINFDNANAAITVYGRTYTAPLPGATITFSPSVQRATTTYDETSGKWITMAPARLQNSDVFLSGLATRIASTIYGMATTVVISGRFTTDTPGVTISSWQWSASVYSNFSNNMNALGVKPCDDATASQWLNNDNAGTPESYKASVIPGAKGLGAPNYTGDYSTGAAVTPAVIFVDVKKMVDAGRGPNSTFGYGAKGTQTFGGFLVEQEKDRMVSKVEVVLHSYVPTTLTTVNDPKLTILVNNQAVVNRTVQNTTFDAVVGAANANTIYIDMTGGRAWRWSDFNTIQVKLDQGTFANGSKIYYDAVGIRLTLVAGTDTSDNSQPITETNVLVDSTKLSNVHPKVVRASDVWAGASGKVLQGQGLTVAVVDSGIIRTEDLRGRVIGAVNFDDDDEEHGSLDTFGHGTFIAGIIAGDGKASAGEFMGIAPKTNILSARVSGDDGVSTEADVVEALQYIYERKDLKKIKVVNLSLNSSVLQSYHTSPLCAAVEVLWFSKVVVVVSAGSNGSANLYPPANGPFVITVGATDDRGTLTMADDIIPSFSAWGVSETGAVKPEIVAPGTRIVSLLPNVENTRIGRDHDDHRVDENYFRMSGTSMAAPVVAGAVALLLQDEPTLNPDQVKYRLMATAAKSDRWPGYNPTKAGAGYLDILAAVMGTTTQTQNTGVRASQLLWTGENPVTWGSVNWSSVNWSSVNWGSVNWSSVNWSSVNWSSDYWGNP